MTATRINPASATTTVTNPLSVAPSSNSYLDLSGTSVPGMRLVGYSVDFHGAYGHDQLVCGMLQFSNGVPYSRVFNRHASITVTGTYTATLYWVP